jgi:transposase
MSRKQQYDAAFKKEIAQVYLSGQRTAPSLSAELGVHVNTIYKWAEQFKTDPENAFPGSGNLKADEAEISRLKRKLRELEEENEILKKAAAYFAKNSK